MKYLTINVGKKVAFDEEIFYILLRCIKLS